MKAKSGQVALYLLLVLVAICLLVLMNVDAFVSVRAKNRLTNAGDAAALAVAGWQRDCLNRIGELNAEHLGLALRTRADASQTELDRAYAACADIVRRQRRICLLDPLEGVRLGNRIACELGAEPSEGMREILLRHIREDLPQYRENDDLYPPAWTEEEDEDHAWDAYAAKLQEVLAEPMYAGPDNVEYVDAVGGHLLLEKQFYNAVSGRAWCWFKFNAPGLLDDYSGFGDWAPLPSRSEDAARRSRCANSEVYSLHLVPRTGSAVQLLGTDLIRTLTGCSLAEIQSSAILTNRSQVWFFYDTDGAWRAWSTYPGIRFNATDFPIVGDVRPEYDVKGAAAICRTTATLPPMNVLADGSSPRALSWTAAAKPFGTVADGAGVRAVTAYRGFVTAAFDNVRLVPVDAVGGRDLSTADVFWTTHVRDHLPAYFLDGVYVLTAACPYCAALKDWERPSVREAGVRYLKYEGENCVRPTGPYGNDRGGTSHGH